MSRTAASVNLKVRVTRPDQNPNLPTEGKTTPWIIANAARKKLLKSFIKNYQYRDLIREHAGRTLYSPKFNQRHPNLKRPEFIEIIKATLEYAFTRDSDAHNYPSVVSARAFRIMKNLPNSNFQTYAYDNYEQICVEVWNKFHGIPEVVSIEPRNDLN